MALQWEGDNKKNPRKLMLKWTIWNKLFDEMMAINAQDLLIKSAHIHRVNPFMLYILQKEKTFATAGMG